MFKRQSKPKGKQMKEIEEIQNKSRRQCVKTIGGGLAMAAAAMAVAQNTAPAAAPAVPNYAASDKKRMLLLSSSRYGSKGFLEHAGDQFKTLYGDKKYKILFVPYAAVSFTFDRFEEMVKAVFDPMGHSITSIHRAADPRAAVMEAEAIAVGGGNSFALLKRMYDNKIVDAISTRVNAGIPYVGWSAGGNVAGPTIRTTNDMPIVEPQSLRALNLIPFQTNPHFISGKPVGHNGESREDRLNEFLDINPTEELIAMPEGTALYCEGEQATIMGEAGMLWFKQGRKVEKMPEGTKFALNSIHP